MDHLSNDLHDLYSPDELGHFYRLSDDRFWNTLDAVGLKKTWQMRHGAQLRHERIVREAVEQRLRKENKVEVKDVEEMLLEDYIEDMEVEDIVLDDEGVVVEITHDEFSHCRRALPPPLPLLPSLSSLPTTSLEFFLLFFQRRFLPPLSTVPALGPLPLPSVGSTRQ